MPFPSLASIEITYAFVMSGQAEPLLMHLRALGRQTHKLLLAACRRHPLKLRVHPAEPRSPIIPVFTSQPHSMARHCQRRGFMVRPIVAPTVPEGSERIRVCLHAGNTMVEVRGLVAAIEAWAAEAADMDERDGREKREEGTTMAAGQGEVAVIAKEVLVSKL